ncbi:MAG: hypothetical protein AAB393_00555, partial [Bacteroidota bacterium]
MGSSVAHTLSGGGSFTNLELNDANGATLSSNITVSGTLTLTSGNITTGSNTLSISSTGTVSRTSGHVAGNLQKNIATGATSKTFEVGDASNYTPIIVSFASVTTAGNLTARTSAGDQPSIGNSSINPAKSVNRYWTLTNSGIVFTNYSATFTFVSGDIDAGASTNNFIVGKLDGGTWTTPTVGTRTATGTQATGMTTFSDFQIGNAVSAIVFRAASSGATSGNATSFTISKPTSAVQNDVLVAQITVNNGSSTSMTAPSAWTLVRRDNRTSQVSQAIYYKVAGASEPASYTWTLSPSDAASGGIVAYSGANTSSPIDASSGGTGSSNIVTAPSVTTTAADEMVVGFFGHDNATTFTPPSGMTERYDVNQASVGVSSEAAEKA